MIRLSNPDSEKRFFHFSNLPNQPFGPKSFLFTGHCGSSFGYRAAGAWCPPFISTLRQSSEPVLNLYGFIASTRTALLLLTRVRSTQRVCLSGPRLVTEHMYVSFTCSNKITSIWTNNRRLQILISRVASCCTPPSITSAGPQLMLSWQQHWLLRVRYSINLSARLLFIIQKGWHVEEVTHHIQSVLPVHAYPNTPSWWSAFICDLAGFHSAPCHHRSGFLSLPVSSHGADHTW